MALMGLILAALATVTAQWMPNWNHGIARVQRSDDVALGLERLATDLAAAEFIAASRETRKPLFDGAARSVIFVRAAFGPNTGPALRLFASPKSIATEARSWSGPERHSRPELTARNPLSQIPSCCCGHPIGSPFHMQGADRNWHEEWRDQIQLPKAIKLTVQDAATQRTLSISTATRVHVEAPMECGAAKSLNDCFTSRARGRLNLKRVKNHGLSYDDIAKIYFLNPTAEPPMVSSWWSCCGCSGRSARSPRSILFMWSTLQPGLPVTTISFGPKRWCRPPSNSPPISS